MKLRKKKEQKNYAGRLLDQRAELTQQLLDEIDKPEPNLGTVVELLSRRDSIARDVSTELDFIENLNWLKGGIRYVSSSIVIISASSFVLTKLLEKFSD